MSRHDFDVLIGGGGMVGAGLAAILAARCGPKGLRIALVEPRPVLTPLPQDKVRVSLDS